MMRRRIPAWLAKVLIVLAALFLLFWYAGRRNGSLLMPPSGAGNPFPGLPEVSAPSGAVSSPARDWSADQQPVFEIDTNRLK